MSSAQPTVAPDVISAEELRQVMEFLFRVTQPGMRPQLVGVVLTNQASAEELHLALKELQDLLPVNTDDQNRRLLIERAPCLEIVRRYGNRLATRRNEVFDPNEVPSEAIINRLLAAHQVWSKQEFTKRRNRGGHR